MAEKEKKGINVYGIRSTLGYAVYLTYQLNIFPTLKTKTLKIIIYWHDCVN